MPMDGDCRAGWGWVWGWGGGGWSAQLVRADSAGQLGEECS
jgi:hypothetical protein